MAVTQDPTVRIEARFKNARLYNAIAASAVPAFHPRPQDLALYEAIGKVHSFCRLYQLSYTRTSDLLNLKIGPAIRIGGGRKTVVRPLCIRLAEILNCEVAWLFPAELYAHGLTPLAYEGPIHQFVSLKAVSRDVLALPPSQYDTMRQAELTDAISRALHTLTPKEEQVIVWRFGLNGETEHTQAEVGERLGVGAVRIGQIEVKALRKLRHHSRLRILEPCDPLEKQDEP